MSSPDTFHIFIFVICILFAIQLLLYVPDIHVECIFIETELQLQGLRYKEIIPEQRQNKDMQHIFPWSWKYFFF